MKIRNRILNKFPKLFTEQDEEKNIDDKNIKRNNSRRVLE